MSRLQVFANEKALGWFGFEAGDYFFEYAPDWLSVNDAYALSPVFLLGQQRFTGPSVKFFFKNLLPEGQVLEALSIEEGMALDNLLEFFATREEVGFAKGRIIVRGKLHRLGLDKRADHIVYLRLIPPLALIESVLEAA